MKDANKSMERDIVTLLGVNIDVIDLPGLMQRCGTIISSRKKAKVMYANIHTINTAYGDEAHMDALNNSHVVYCDGEGVRWGAKILGRSLPRRMTGADWIWDLCEMCETMGYSLYFLGGESGVAEKTAQKLQEKFTGLKIVDTHHGYFRKCGKENNSVIASINEKSPDIVLVGFGSPLQERWIHENFEKLNARLVWAMGAAMDFVSGKVPRGPQWMLDNGMEWLFRLIVEPRRMWKRYILGNTLFLGRVMRERIRK